MPATRSVDVPVELSSLRSRIALHEAMTLKSRRLGDGKAERRSIIGRLRLERDVFQLGFAGRDRIVMRDGEYLYEFAPGQHHPISELIPGC